MGIPSLLAIFGLQLTVFNIFWYGAEVSPERFQFGVATLGFYLKFRVPTN